jgi:uncharacterized protein (TIGR03437 family)
MRKEILILTLLGVSAYAQALRLDPSSVSNAASQIPPRYPNGGVSHGGMFIVKAAAGSGALGACGIKLADAFPIATSMNGTTMKITAGSSSYDVPMIYVVACQNFPDQLAGIVPSSVPPGAGTLVVSYGGQSASAPIVIADRTPGIFTVNQGGTGPAIIQNFNSASDLPVNLLTAPAKPGQYAILWGTGLGPDGNSDVDAPKPTDLPLDVEVLVGGKRAAVTYRGRSGCCAGIDQVVFVVPDGINGCFVPVSIRIGNAVSNFTTMSVSATGDACSDPSFLTASDVQSAQRNNRIRIGLADVVRADLERVTGPNSGVVTRTDTASAAFDNLSYLQLLGLPVREISSPGACTVWRGGSDVLVNRPALLSPLVNLDAGTIRLAGASGNASLGYGGGYRLGLGTASYREPAGGPTPSTSFLEPGNLTLSSGGGGPVPGGKPIGAWNAQVSVPLPPRFDNRFSIGDVQRAQGITVNWSGADSNAMVTIRGVSNSNDPTAPPVAFFCLEKASAAQFTIPPAVLLSLPASSSADSIGLSVGTTSVTRFSAPNVDAAFARATALFGRSLNFK